MAFSNCLGELMSVVADQIQVKIQTQPCDIPFSLTKVYSESGDSLFSQPPVLSGDRKEAIFLLNFPPTSETVPDNHFVRPVKASVTYNLTRTGERVEQEIFLEIPVYNESVEIDSIELDEDVMVNFYRVKTASKLKEAAEFGEIHDMNGAQSLLDRGIEELKNCVVAQNPVVQVLIKDMESAKLRFVTYEAYEHGGRAEIKSKFRGHYNKRAQEHDLYTNSYQKETNISAQNYFSKH